MIVREDDAEAAMRAFRVYDRIEEPALKRRAGPGPILRACGSLGKLIVETGVSGFNSLL